MSVTVTDTELVVTGLVVGLIVCLIGIYWGWFFLSTWLEERRDRWEREHPDRCPICGAPPSTIMFERDPMMLKCKVHGPYPMPEATYEALKSLGGDT